MITSFDKCYSHSSLEPVNKFGLDQNHKGLTRLRYLQPNHPKKNTLMQNRNPFAVSQSSDLSFARRIPFPRNSVVEINKPKESASEIAKSQYYQQRQRSTRNDRTIGQNIIEASNKRYQFKSPKHQTNPTTDFSQLKMKSIQTQYLQSEKPLEAFKTNLNCHTTHVQSLLKNQIYLRSPHSQYASFKSKVADRTQSLFFKDKISENLSRKNQLPEMENQCVSKNSSIMMESLRSYESDIKDSNDIADHPIYSITRHQERKESPMNSLKQTRQTWKQNFSSDLPQKQTRRSIQKKSSEFPEFNLDFESKRTIKSYLDQIHQSQSKVSIRLNSKQHDGVGSNFLLGTSRNRQNEDEKQKILIEEYEKQNHILEQQNNQIERQIQQQISKQRSLLTRLNALMQNIESIKKKQTCILIEEQLKKTIIQRQMESSQSQLLDDLTFQNQQTNLIHLQNQQQKRSFTLQTQNRKQFLSLNNNQMISFSPRFKNSSTKRNNNFLDQEKQNIRSDRFDKRESRLVNTIDLKFAKRKRNIGTETILEYSQMDESSLNLAKNNPTFKKMNPTDFISRNKNENRDPILSSMNVNEFIDLSISQFDSRLVPKLTHQQKISELQQLFQTQLKRFNSIQNRQQDKIQSKQKLKKLSQQINDIRKILSEQTQSDPKPK